ncbi:MAG: excinuclease ABC subunit UvrA, partial [Pirellulaceae bacterium]|nr:excinuclease ABC subunit UvrA [Pirellulaceae bacterium]
KNLTVKIPLGKLVCVTGVSGSGKSSLVGDILVPVLRRHLHAGEEVPGKHHSIEGIEHLDKMIDIDQSPIGRTPRSNPATYVKVFDEIRNIYTDLPEAKRRGYAPGRFSFNIAGGRCEACEGNGSNKLGMDFLSDLWITCPVCEGRRYNHETLQVLFKGKSIAEVLDMDVQQALELFENIPRIRDKLQTLHDVGMDYIKLGQPSPTLSGGEAQRVKLAKELSRRDTGRTLYLLDEPTTGLHFHDIRLLLNVMQDLVDRGNSVLVIEHNLDIIKAADWIIDLGPEGGGAGGELVFEGTPDEILSCDASHTGRSLAKHLAMAPVQGRAGKTTRRSATQSAAKKKSAGKGAVAAAHTMTPVLKIQGATQHNLKDVSLELEHNTLTVFCGPSGSGKSSLAMDTIYAEGQRRYVESLSSYARQFVGQMPKPPVEHIAGLAPSIAIEQKSVAHNPRSTVGTVTEIYDYLRVLMARLGVPHCPDCDIPVSTQTAQQIAATIMKHPVGTRLILAAPLQWRPNQAPNDLWQELRTAGLHRVRLGGKTYTLDEPPRLATNAHNDLQVVIDRIVVTPENRARIAESVEQALSRGQGVMFAIESDESREEPDWTSVRHSQHLACQQCGLSLETLTPHSFSFNTPLGWCAGCEGLGTQSGTDPNLIVDMGRTLLGGGLRLFPHGATDIAFEMLSALAKGTGMPLDAPLEKYTGSVRRALLYGTGDRWFRIETGAYTGLQFQWKGLMPALEEAARQSPAVRAVTGPRSTFVTCADCDGSRLTRGPASAKFRGLTMGDIVRQSLAHLHETINSWQLDEREQQIAGEVLLQINARTEFLIDVGLEYLSLSRAANTLSGGESQRIRLASQLGSGLCGVMYVLDEPTIGLHPRDNSRLLRALTKLRDLGNTLIVVEHDRDIIAGSDGLCDFGPGAGRYGGTLVAQGTPDQIASSPTSVTGPYLSGQTAIPIPENRRSGAGATIRVTGARENTLRDVDVAIPLSTLTVVTGPSGSGKSTLVNEILLPAVSQRGERRVGPNYRLIEGASLINKVIRVDQSPLGQNPSSTPATYTGVFELIRQLYAQMPTARARGFTARQFSFNVPGGRCEKCEGYGQLRIEMHFLPDVWVECDSCHGRRFTEDTLSVKYHEYSIHDILEMEVGKALEVMSNIPKIRRILQTLVDVGLDYVALGQSAPTLSGGEAQRVKLAAELARPNTGNTLYFLDEPTTGLHFCDVGKLLLVLHRLVDLGNTVVVIEHNLDVIKSADWVIDMGPEAGWGGGQVVVAGTPEQMVEHARRERAAAGGDSPTQANGTALKRTSVAGKAAARRRATPASAAEAALSPATVNTLVDGRLLRSYTGEALAEILARGPYAHRERFDPAAYHQAQVGDLELDQIGRETLLPWQADGPRWHREDCVDRKGGAIQWDRAILIKVTEVMEKKDGFIFNWENRYVVEVTARVKSLGWFFQAHTGDTWLLKLKFRVPRTAFTDQQLLDVVTLPTLNQMPEIQAYGNQSRVKLSKDSGWVELEICAFKLDEIDTPKFWKWLNSAIKAFLSSAPAEPVVADIESHMPWKVLGHRWHAMRKGFPVGRDVAWPAETLSVLVQTLHQVGGAQLGRWQWDDQTQVKVWVPGYAEPWVTMHTKRPEGLIVVLTGPPLDELDQHKAAMPVALNWTNRSPGVQQLQLSFTETLQPRDAAFKKLLTAHLSALGNAVVK